MTERYDGAGTMWYVPYTVGDCFFDALVWLLWAMLGVRTNVRAMRAAGCAALRGRVA